jgi:hypothetical protein
MTIVEEIETAVANLSNDNLAKFRAWFQAFDAERFDYKIRHDAGKGIFDGLIDVALSNFCEGCVEEI